MLLDDNGVFHHQISIGSSVSANSASGDETPNTAATMVSESPFTFENPHPMNGAAFAQENGGVHFNRSGSGLATLPLINGSTLYPIPEDAPTSHTLPFPATPSHYPSPSDHPPSYPYHSPAPPSSVGVPDKYKDEPVEMTDNPLNDAFEKKMVSWRKKGNAV